MRWVIGIDEAGYGPNLGPLLQAAVALRLPDDDLAGWTTLANQIRRAHEPDDGRWLIDDSKKIYPGPEGLESLALGLFFCINRSRVTLAECLQCLCLPGGYDDARRECWFDGEVILEPKRSLARLEVESVDPSVNLVLPTRFNRILDQHDSKAVVLSHGLIELIRTQISRLPNDENIDILCDKHGGRNFYGAMLADAFTDRWVHPLKETAGESRYRIDEADRSITVTFCPRADGNSVAVALASMICKYLRELCMLQFNAYWVKQVANLKPTAGYPVDARRFYAEIQPTMITLGIQPDAIWRRK